MTIAVRGGTLAAALAVLAFSAPAMAQPADSIENRFLAEIEPCIAASENKALPANQLADICGKASVSLTERMRRQQLVTAAEVNLYHGLSVAVMNIQANAIVTYDRAASKRACDVAEAAWTIAQKIDPALNPDWSADLATMRSGSLDMVRQCRRVNGAPFGAPTLPAF